MLNPFGNEKIPGSYHGLQKRILQRLKTGGIEDQITEILKAACEEAWNAENVVLARSERKKLLSDVLNTFFEDLMRRFRGRGDS